MYAYSVREPYHESTADCTSLVALLNYAWQDVNRRSPCAAYLLLLCIAVLDDEIAAEKPTTGNGGAPEKRKH
jgi:hypothetical protein